MLISTAVLITSTVAAFLGGIFLLKQHRLQAGTAVRMLALAGTIGVCIYLAPTLVDDGGTAALYEVCGVPFCLALLPIIFEGVGRLITFVTLVCAIGMTSWGLLLGLGEGFAFIYPALVLWVAAVVPSPRRSARRGSNEPSPRRFR